MKEQTKTLYTPSTYNHYQAAGRKQSKNLWYGIIIVVVVFILFATPWGGFFASKVPTPPGGAVTTQQTNAQGQPVTGSGTALPIQFNVVDKWAGGGVNAPTITVYEGTQKFDSSAASSAGVLTTSNFYSPGTNLNVLVVKSNTKQYFTVTVPSISSIQSQSQVYAITLNYWTLGTYSIIMTDNLGNTYSTGGCFNMSTLAGSTAQCGGSGAAAKPGTTPATLTITAYDSVTNTGYTSSYDPINNVNWYGALIIQDAGKVSITGYGQSFQRGTNTSYYTRIPDSSLTCIQVGQVITGCNGATSLTIAIGTVAHGAYETQTIYVYGYFDPTYWGAQGTGSPNVVQLATATLKVAK